MLVPNGTAYTIDTRIASMMLIRRDVTVEDWSDPVEGQHGVRATTLVRLRHTTKQRHRKNDQHKKHPIDEKLFCLCFVWKWLVVWVLLFWLCFGLCLVFGLRFLLLLEVG